MNPRAIATPILLAALLIATDVSAQSARISGVTTVQYVQLRPLVADSVSAASAIGDGILRRTTDGQLVRCVTGDRFCRYLRSAGTETVVPVIQDITVNAWGLARGLRVQAQLRTRAAIGGQDELWPLADDPFDALTAFLELDRPRFRARAGRQWKVSGLGYYNYDGASVLFRARPGLSVEAFGGWSLARGLNEPRTSESLTAIEAFAPDTRTLLVGAQASYRPSPALALGALYQREIRDDRLGLHAERIAVDGSYRWGLGSVTGTLEADVATRTVNDARLGATVSVRPDLAGRAFARAYRPFFELWTIWGAFDPVGFGEVGAGAAWRPAERPYRLDIEFSRRSYEETNASTVFGEYRSSAWSFRTNGSLRVQPVWTVQGDYRVEFGFGAARTEASARVQRDFTESTYLGASVLAFERAFEMRVANGTVYGLGLDGRLRLGPRTGVSGSLSAFRHLAGDAPDVDWSQLRGLVRFEWTLGPEPGLPALGGGGR